MKRLLCVLSGMNVGGAETFLMKIFRSLDREKYSLDFCVNVKDNFYASEIEKLGGKIYVIPPKSQNLKEFRKGLYDVVANGKYEYVLRVTSSAMGFMDLKIAKKAGARVCAARSSNSGDGKGLKAKVAHIAGRLLYGRYVDVKLAPSDLAAKHTFGKRAYKNGEVAIVRNGVDTSVYAYDAQARKKIRAEFGVSDDAFVVGHIGRFSAQKNHEFLLDIFKEVKNIRPDAVLMLVGKGELEKSVREKAERAGVGDSVIFTGVRSDVPSLLSAFDAFAFPSFYEGMPNTVIEAQATGLKCVISDAITREADITGLVAYKSLGDAPEEWAKELLKDYGARQSQKDKFRAAGYDVSSACDDFVRTVFGV